MLIICALHPERMMTHAIPIHKIQSQLMEMPITHGFAPERHILHYDCNICKKPGDYRSQNVRLLHGIKATENQALKICVASEIKCLVKHVDDIFYELQFSRQRQTCLSAIILKQITIYSVMLTKTPGIIIDNDTTGAFDCGIFGLALIALRSIRFAIAVTIMSGVDME
jgi:hypothetical protein